MSAVSKLRGVWAILILLAAVCCLAAALTVANLRLLAGLYNNVVLGNRDPMLRCAELPALAEVNRVVVEHQEVIQAIGQVDPRSVFVEIDTVSCPGKADLVIWFGTQADRAAVERIIAGDKFFGVPYRMYNH